MGAPNPQFIPEAFAVNAAPGFRNTIPTTTVTAGRASFDLGFPPITMTPIIAGGKPPLGQDVNGILYMISSHTVYQQTGKPYKYNADVVVAVGGYDIGTLLGSTDGLTLWFNIAAANTTDPDAGGPGWVSMFSYGLTTTTSGLTGGTRTLTSAEAARGVIVLSGALTSNLQVVFPNWFKSWLVVNNTSGAFTTTVKTASGTGVVIPQGGFGAPVEVYVNGPDLYPTVAPLTIPTSVAPVPDTYVLRSNAGYVFATYLNQNSGLENPAISAVFCESGSDGFLRKIAPGNFATKLSLNLIGGQVTAGQVPQSAVTQYAAAILASAALTGTPTATTPPAGDNSTRVATTAYVQGAITAAQNGSTTLPNGLILKWGYAVGAGGPGLFNIPFPVAFPNNIFAAFMSTAFRTGQGSNTYNFVGTISTASMNVVADTAQTGPNNGLRNCYYFAVGN